MPSTGWNLVLKATSEIGEDVSTLWLGSQYTASPTDAQKELTTTSQSHYKHENVERWNELPIRRVTLSYCTFCSKRSISI